MNKILLIIILGLSWSTWYYHHNYVTMVWLHDTATEKHYKVYDGKDPNNIVVRCYAQGGGYVTVSVPPNQVPPRCVPLN